MAPRKRDYAREYSRRQELARQRGFRSYGQQRRYLEYTGAEAKDIRSIGQDYIEETFQRYTYSYDQYEYGDDKLLDAWIRRSQGRGIDEEEAYNSYKQAARGGNLTRRQIGNLSRRLYNEEWDQKWATS